MLMVLGGLGASNAYAQAKPVSGAWFAAKGAAQAAAAGRSGPMPGVPGGVLNSSARQHAESRQELEHLMEGRVFLELWVKVRSGWADDEARVRSFGYE
mgnify:CR=1 FL=1